MDLLLLGTTASFTLRHAPAAPDRSHHRPNFYGLTQSLFTHWLMRALVRHMHRPGGGSVAVDKVGHWIRYFGRDDTWPDSHHAALLLLC
jgi:hypothetical protein